jgi:hypothetical protein
MIPFLATEFHSVAGQNKFPKTGTNRPNMPRNGKLVTVLVTDSISVAKQNDIPLKGKNMLHRISTNYLR